MFYVRYSVRKKKTVVQESGGRLRQWHDCASCRLRDLHALGGSARGNKLPAPAPSYLPHLPARPSPARPERLGQAGRPRRRAGSTGSGSAPRCSAWAEGGFGGGVGGGRVLPRLLLLPHHDSRLPDAERTAIACSAPSLSLAPFACPPLRLLSPLAVWVAHCLTCHHVNCPPRSHAYTLGLGFGFSDRIHPFGLTEPVNVVQERICEAGGVTMRVKAGGARPVTDWWPWPWPWPWAGGDDDAGEVSADQNPVLLVPGIGGSILQAVDAKGRKERIWVRLFAADHEFRAKLFSLYDPVTGKTNSLDTTTTIEVPDDRFGLYSCDILDPAVIFRMDDVYYFHDLIKQLTDWGYREGTTLFGFGYDFRQSNRLSEHCEKFKAKLESMYEASGGKKADIISHSMGGILVKSFLALHHDFFEKYVNSWITIAAPFQGAPGFIMDCLLTGVEFVKGWQRQLFVAKWSMHQLLIECPSVYELMASDDFPWTDPPELRLWRKQTEETGKLDPECPSVLERYGPKDYLQVMSAALRGNTMNYNGVIIPTPMNTEILEWAEKTRLILRIAELPASVRFYNIVGTSIDTPFHTCYGSKENPIEELTDILALEADFSFVDGDGTVPLESSMSDGLNAEMRIGIPGDHRAILNDKRLFTLLKHFLNVGDPDPMYDPVWDFVVVPRPEVEVQRDDYPSIGVVEEESEVWQFVVSDDAQTGMQSRELQEHCVATVTTGLGAKGAVKKVKHRQSLWL